MVQAKLRREAIRQSWAKTITAKSLPVQLKFILAQPVAEKLRGAHQLLLVGPSFPNGLFH